MPFEGAIEISDRDMLLLAFGAILASDDSKLSEIEALLRKHLFSVETQG